MARSLDYEADDVLVVSDPAQLRALADDLRAKIVARLRDRAWSTQELAADLGLPKGTVGHHLKVLERAGLIRVVRTRQVRAVTEKHYGRVARLFLFQSEEAPETVGPLGGATLRQAADELQAAPAEPQFGLVRARLTPADARRLERRAQRLMDAFRASDSADGDLHGLVTGLYRVAE